MFRRGRISSQISAPSLVLFSVGWCIGSARGGRLRPRPSPSLSLFGRPFRHPKTAGNSPPHAFRLGRVSSATHPPHSSRSSVGWCVYWQNGGHLRSRPRPSLNFSMGALLAPKTRGTRAWAAPPSTCTGLMGRCGAVTRVHGGCCHGERGQSRWG